jgi:hypothetical protein
MKSFTVLNGESARTTMIDGSSTSRAIDVSSSMVTVASACTKGLLTKTLEKIPMT